MRPLTRELKWVFWLFAALALVAGVLLFVLSEQTDESFSWTIEPPLTAAFLGASFWAASLLLVWTARQRTWANAQAAVPPVLSIAVLLAAATLVHLDRFHKDLFGWFWVSVYLIVPPLLVLLVWRQLRVPGSGRARALPLSTFLRAALIVQALVMIAVGGALFVAPADADTLWPWPLTPLTARAVGAFTLGFGIAAADAARQNELRRFEGAAFAYAALGVLELVAIVRYWGDLTGTDFHRGAYIAFLVSVLVVSGYAWRRAGLVGR